MGNHVFWVPSVPLKFRYLFLVVIAPIAPSSAIAVTIVKETHQVYIKYT
jgi:hypothetical protein